MDGQQGKEKHLNKTTETSESIPVLIEKLALPKHYQIAQEIRPIPLTYVITSSSSAVTENSNVTKLDLKTQLHTNQRSSEQNQALHVVPVLNTKKLQPNQKYSVCYSSNNSSQGAYGCTESEMVRVAEMPMQVRVQQSYVQQCCTNMPMTSSPNSTDLLLRSKLDNCSRQKLVIQPTDANLSSSSYVPNIPNASNNNMSQNVASKNVVMHNIQEADDTLNEKKTSTEENLEDVLPGSYLAALLNGTTQSKNNANNSSGFANNNEACVEIFDCHAKVLLERLNLFRKEGDYCDLTIEIGKMQWPCHSVVVAAICPLLHNLIQSKCYSNSNNTGGMTIKLPSQLDNVAFSCVLDMMYSGLLLLAKNTVKNLLFITTYMKLSLAQAKCEYYNAKWNGKDTGEMIRILIDTKKLQRPTLCVNLLTKPNDNEVVQDVVSKSIYKPSTHDMIESEKPNFPQCKSANMNEDSLSLKTNEECVIDSVVSQNKVPLFQGRKLRSSHATFTNIQSPTDRIFFTNTKTLVQETCNQMKDFDNNSVTTNEESFHARNTKLEKENSNVAGKPTSFTNLMRVAYEAFKDLDQESEMETAISEDKHDDNEKQKDLKEKDSSQEESDFKSNFKETELSQSTAKAKSIRKKQKKKLHKCQFCDKIFMKKFDRRLHERRIHTKEKPYACTQCGKGFHLNRELQHHVKTHQDGYVHSCLKCNKSFLSETGYKYHMAAHGDKKYSCQQPGCGKTFVTVALRNRHEKVHSLNKPYKCTECEFSFKSNYELQRHIKLHKGVKPFKCEVCEKSFSRGDYLRIHIATHSSERGFKCNECGRTFKQKTGLNHHKQKHVASSFRYICDVCGHRCTKQYYLKEHYQIHTSDLPFNCDICFSSFKLAKYLKKHKKIHDSRGENCPEKYKKRQNKPGSVVVKTKNVATTSAEVIPTIYDQQRMVRAEDIVRIIRRNYTMESEVIPRKKNRARHLSMHKQ